MNLAHRFARAATIALVAVVAATAFADDGVVLSSPTGVAQARVRAVDDGLSYDLTFNGKPVLTDSKIGTTFKGERLGALKIVGVRESSRDVVWTQRLGKSETQVDRYNETTIELREAEGGKRGWNAVLRAYDDAFAFRFELPQDGGLADENGDVVVESDDSTFNFGDGALDAWASFYPTYNTSQEEIFKKVKLSDIKSDSFVGAPLIVQTQDWNAALTEADLVDWSGAQFAAAAPGVVSIRLTPRNDGRGAVVRQSPASSPWRVVLLGKTAVDMVDASKEIQNLARPCELDDVSWIEPGNCAWDWWAPKSGRKMTNERFKEFVDFAAERGWKWLLVDAGWARRDKFGANASDRELFAPGFDAPSLVEYARARNVGIFLWFHWTDLQKEGERKLLQRCADWGVRGVKIDFMDSHAQEMVQWTTKTCQIAAELKLLVDYHGMYKPTGFERTYPNQITREGVRGNEYNRWSRQTATHVATLPFTRCMLGPADYTPGGVLNRHGEEFVSLDANKAQNATCQVVGTRAHELALCMIVDSPIRCLCDLPENYRGQSGLEYVDALPTVWRKTRALQGEIGEYFVVMRESFDGEFFASAITNESPRKLELKLDFLPEGQDFEATFYADSEASDQDATAIAIESKTVRSGDVLTIDMAREGGWNAVFREK